LLEQSFPAQFTQQRMRINLTSGLRIANYNASCRYLWEKQYRYIWQSWRRLNNNTEERVCCITMYITVYFQRLRLTINHRNDDLIIKKIRKYNEQSVSNKNGKIKRIFVIEQWYTTYSPLYNIQNGPKK